MKKTTPEDLKNTQTEHNLMLAFACESQARNKYTYYASVAKKEGYEQIGDLFKQTADNEKEHAELWYETLGGIKKTEDNLTSAIKGEEYEFEELYPNFEKIALEEGFKDIAQKFHLAASIEKSHHERFKKLLENIINDEVFTKKTGIHVWKCRNCGNLITSKSAPLLCPFCNQPQSYFELNQDNY